jgi:hypothetical protein
LFAFDVNPLTTSVVTLTWAAKTLGAGRVRNRVTDIWRERADDVRNKRQCFYMLHHRNERCRIGEMCPLV